MRGKKLRNTKGITLIALVITIIVLVILAGVSINLLLGENGIVKRALQAAEEYRTAAENEQLFLNELEGLEGFEGISSELQLVVNKSSDAEKIYSYLIINFDGYNKGEKIDFTECTQISYEEYAQNIIENSSPDEINDMYFNFLLYNQMNSFQQAFPGQQLTKEFLVELDNNYDSYEELIEDLYVQQGYNTLEEMLISEKLVKPEGYDFNNNIQKKYVIRLESRTSTIFDNGNNGNEKLYAIFENGEFIFSLENTETGDKTYTKLVVDNIVTDVEFEFDAPHPEQINSTAIGVAEDGTLVNMDLWEWNVEQTPFGMEAYLNKYTGHEKIIGKVPMYIKESDEYAIFTDMNYTFADNVDLEVAPEIPSSIMYMEGTFSGCTSLTKAPVIPNGVVDMEGTFAECTSLTVAPEIPSSVTNIEGTFSGCTSLTKAPELPSSVTDMSYTFAGCTSLTKAPVIPSNVIYMEGTFADCIGLIEVPELPNSIIEMKGTFEGCISLTVAPKIPSSVTYMEATFSGCTSLIIAPELPNIVECLWETFEGCTSLTTAPVIPSSANDMEDMFYGCSSLTGILEINADYLEYTSGCLTDAATNDDCNLVLTGSSPYIEDIYNTKSDNSKITM